jgi:hypothetical protein
MSHHTSVDSSSSHSLDYTSTVNLSELIQTNDTIKNILKSYSTYEIDRILKPLISGGMLEVINDKLQIGENPTTTNTLPDHIQLHSPDDDKLSYTQSHQFQSDLSDIIQSNIKSNLKKQPLEQKDIINKFKDNTLLSQIDSELIMAELNNMITEGYIKKDETMYYPVIY